jgi:hypothetical protein
MLAKGYRREALHEYTDRNGNPLYYRIRVKHPETGDKWIRPMKLDGDKYVLGEPEFSKGKPLYRLHQLCLRPNERVNLVEGEKCVDVLEKLGLLATTSGAADSFENADWSVLAGRDVDIWTDNDEAGRRYAAGATAKLLALGCNVTHIAILELGLPPKGDCVDWLAANPGATVADVLALPRVVSPQPRQLSASISPTCALQPKQPGTLGIGNESPSDQYGEWPEPQPLVSTVEPERYPIEALPPLMRPAVEEVAAFVKAPLPLVASSAQAALSLAIQPHVDMKRAEKLLGPVGLFLLTVADSGERKSTCDGFFLKGIRDYEEAQAEALKPVVKDYEAASKAWEAKRGGVLEKIKQLAKNGKPTADFESDLRDLEQDRPTPPRVPRLLYADATPEALAYGLAKHWPCGGVVSAEAGVVLGSHGMGKDSLMRNLAMLNQLWDGSSLTIDRKTTDSFTVRGARLTIALQVQETTLKEFFERSGALARGIGFLARFLLSWPESTQGFRPFTEAPENWPNLAAFNHRLTEILNEPLAMDDDGALTPRILTLTPDAKAAWVEYHNEIEQELGSGGELYDVRDVASKSADNAARLAALFHVLEHGTDDSVCQGCFEAASLITLWHLNEALRFFGELALPDELADAVKLDNWIINYCRRKGTNLVPIAEVQQRGPRQVRSKAAIDEALLVLEELGRARLVHDGLKKMVAVNPALLREEVVVP